MVADRRGVHAQLVDHIDRRLVVLHGGVEQRRADQVAGTEQQRTGWVERTLSFDRGRPLRGEVARRVDPAVEVVDVEQCDHLARGMHRADRTGHHDTAHQPHRCQADRQLASQRNSHRVLSSMSVTGRTSRRRTHLAHSASIANLVVAAATEIQRCEDGGQPDELWSHGPNVAVCDRTSAPFVRK